MQRIYLYLPHWPIVSYAAICDMGLFVFFQSEKNVSIFLLLKVISIHCQMRKEFYRPCHLHMRIKQANAGKLLTLTPGTELRNNYYYY